MSEILDILVTFARKGEHRPLERSENIALTRYLLEDLHKLESFLNGKGDSFTFDERLRYGFHALDNLVLNGCPYCNGDVAITGLEALNGRCCKCGQWVTDYEV